MPADLAQLHDVFDRAEYVRVSESGAQIAVYHGGPYVNLYIRNLDGDMEAVDALYVGGDDDHAVERANKAIDYQDGGRRG